MTVTTPAWWQYADHKRIELGLSVKEFADRGDIGLSHAYQILQGKRPQATLETLRSVAKALGMSPAELLTGMGEGIETEPDVIEAMALYRQVPHGDRHTARQILLALTSANSHTPPTAKKATQAGRKLKTDTRRGPENDAHDPLTVRSHLVRLVHSIVPNTSLALSVG